MSHKEWTSCLKASGKGTVVASERIYEPRFVVIAELSSVGSDFYIVQFKLDRFAIDSQI